MQVGDFGLAINTNRCVPLGGLGAHEGCATVFLLRVHAMLRVRPVRQAWTSPSPCACREKPMSRVGTLDYMPPEVGTLPLQPVAPAC